MTLLDQEKKFAGADEVYREAPLGYRLGRLPRK